MLKKCISRNKKSRHRYLGNDFFFGVQRRPTLTGGDAQLPSALKSLTSVFGMGTGVTSSPSSLDNECLMFMFVSQTICSFGDSNNITLLFSICQYLVVKFIENTMKI